MPNNPGRIDGDYSIGEKEEVRYVQPPSGFGAVKKKEGIGRKYIFAAAIVITALILFIILR